MSAVLRPDGAGPVESLPPPRVAPVGPAVLPSRGPGRRELPAQQNRASGIAVVVGVHLLVGWALASGLGRQVIEIVKKPITMSIIPEQAPPPPPPPPKIEKPLETPKAATPPPPSYVPPPEVVPVAAPAPVITATRAEPPKEPVVIAPPAPPAPEPKPAPAPVKQEISLACPGYQAALASVLEDAFERVGITGTVRTRLLVRGNQVVEATILSGPKEYTKYVQTAVKRMKCSAGGADEIQVPLDVNFRP